MYRSGLLYPLGELPVTESTRAIPRRADLRASVRHTAGDVTDVRNAAALALPADSQVVLYCC